MLDSCDDLSQYPYIVPTALWQFEDAGISFPEREYARYESYQDLLEVRSYNYKRAKQALVYFSGIFEPYPFPKLDFVFTDKKWDMEYAGLINLLKGGESTVHEVIHQWWGNRVRIKHYGDLWISEGFANYFTALFKEIHGLDPDDTEPVTAEMAETRGNELYTDPRQIFSNEALNKVSRNQATNKDPVSNAMAYLDPIGWVTPYWAIYHKGSYVVHDLRIRIAELKGQNLYDNAARDLFLRVINQLYIYSVRNDGFLTTEGLLSWLRENLANIISVNPSEAVQLVDDWETEWLCKNGGQNSEPNCLNYLVPAEEPLTQAQDSAQDPTEW